MKANSEKTKQSNKATRRVLAGVLCGASVLSLVLSLVMPPISQAIANDAQAASTGGTVTEDSSSESTDVDNTNNGDTENLNSYETEGGEPGNDTQLEGQSEEEQQYEGATTSDDKTVVVAAEGEQAGTAAVEINNETELSRKIQDVAENQSGSFKLIKDLDCNEEIFLNKKGSNITLDLNGFKIKHSGEGNKPLFSVSNGAEFTITDFHPGEDKIADTQPLQNQGQDLTAKNYGKTAEMSYVDDVPTKLTYYVTKSSVDTTDSTRTNETTDKHEVTINGAIVGTKDSAMRLINVYTRGTFNLQGGVLTTTQHAKVGNLIYAENGSTVNMSGGYVCGATSTGQGAGIELKDKSTTLNLTGGVIAGNYAPNGGGVYAKGSTINMTSGTIAGKKTSGTISGNGTFENQAGYGAGICALGSTVTISDGYITNNNCQFNYKTQNKENDHKGFGCHGGGGIAAYDGGSLQISGGCITGNYSAEAGGGVYAGHWAQSLEKFKVCGGIIASNVAELSEGGGIRIAAPTVGEFEVPKGSHAYITNNTTNTTNDWGGGGVFVQGGNSDQNVNSASLKIYNALITENQAMGYGGGFAACPTGKTAITDTKGIAIFDNTDNTDSSGVHLSGGTGGKSEDQDEGTKDTSGQITATFKQNGHKDLFLIRKSDNNNYIAAVTGQMLGGGAANWSGTIDNKQRDIGKYEGAQAKYMIGLAASPTETDKTAAKTDATLYITGNKSNIHGGGIMTNGDVIAGFTTQVNVYPKMKLNGTKALAGRALKDGEFKFQLLKQGTEKQDPSFANHKLQLNGCTKVGDGVTNDGGGNFAFNLGEVYSDDSIVYYLVEDPGDTPVSGVTYDEAIYKIAFETTVAYTQPVLNITYTYYSVTSVRVTNLKTNESKEITPSNGRDVSIEITDGNTSNTFTNAYKPKGGSWTPQVTKKVDGGKMKAFEYLLA